jgi:hypothetical protein
MGSRFISNCLVYLFVSYITLQQGAEGCDTLILESASYGKPARTAWWAVSIRRPSAVSPGYVRLLQAEEYYYYL